MLISAEHLNINFGSRQLLQDVDFYLKEGDKTGVSASTERENRRSCA